MNKNKAKIAVFISGSGTNLQALIDATKDGSLDAEIVLVVSNTTKAFGLKRAEKEGIETFVFKTKKYPSEQMANEKLFSLLKEKNIDYIALAGYLKLIPISLIKAYKNHVVNIHPALLPEYGGKGMYGHFVHEAVIANQEKESGVTIHLVDEQYDRGNILEQVRVPVLPDDTPEKLASRILIEEHKLYPKVLDNLIKGKYKIDE